MPRKHKAAHKIALRAKVNSLLKKPGEGLLTVTTGSGKAEKILGPLFGSISKSDWLAQSRRRIKGTAPQIIALPSDTGGGICRGAAHGPLALREALYSRHPHWAACDLGDLPCIPQILDDSMITKVQIDACGKSLWGTSYRAGAPVSPLNLLKEFLIECFESEGAQFRPFVIGGDHSISGSVFEALYATRKTSKLAVLHFDAHTDLLESRYGVDYCFATWAAHAVQRLIPSRRSCFVQVGLRVSGQTQSFWERKFGLKQYWARQIQKSDPKFFAQKLLSHWKKMGCNSIYISFDVDALDPKWVPSTGTPEAGGLSVTWCRKVIEEVTRELPLVAADLVELAPVLGSQIEGRRSSQNAARIAESLLKALRRPRGEEL